MLTLDQIQAEGQTALEDIEVKNLLLLVKQYPIYVANLGLFPGLVDYLEAEQVTPTVNTQILHAVLTALNELPAIVVESQGRSDAPSHFSVQENWNSLALDVLNLFYDIPAGLLSYQSFALVTRTVQSLMIDDDMNLILDKSLLTR